MQQRRRFVPGQSARHSSSSLSSSLSSSDGSCDEKQQHKSNQADSNGSKYLHLVIRSNLHPGREGNDLEEREGTEEEGSMARSGCTLDRFGDLGIDDNEENDEADDEAEVASSEEDDDIDASVEKDENVNAGEATCVEFEPDVMYDDEGNRIEFMYDDEGNRVEKIDPEDDDIIWQEDNDDDLEETEERKTRPIRDGLPPLAPPKRNSSRADIRERFNQTGQSWLRTKQLLNHQQQQSHDKAELSKENSRKLYLSDSDSTEEVVETEQQALPPISQKQKGEARHVRFANVVDTRVFLAEEENDEQEIEDVAVEPPESQARREEAANRMESMRMTLEGNGDCDDDADDNVPQVDVEEDEESEVYNTRNFDEMEEREEVEVEDKSVLNGEMIGFFYSRGSTVPENISASGMKFVVNTHVQQSAYGLKPPRQHQLPRDEEENWDDGDEDEVGGSFYFLDSPKDASEPPVPETESKQSSRKPPLSPKTPAHPCKTSDLTNLYDGSVGDVRSILNDLQGGEVGNQNVNSPATDDDNVDDEEEVNANLLVGDDDSGDDFNREKSASPNERDCMKRNDDVLRSYQLMKEREEKQLEIKLQDAAMANAREEPAVAAPLKTPKVPEEMQNPRYPYRHGHSLGDEVSDIFTEMSSLGPWAVSKKMDGYSSRVPSVQKESRSDPRNDVFHNQSELIRSDEDITPISPPHRGWVRPDLSLDDSMGDSLVGKMLTLVPSPRANPSMLSTPFEDEDDEDNDNAKRRRWPFGKKKKKKDSHTSGAANILVEKERGEHRRNLDHRHAHQSVHRFKNIDSIENYRYEEMGGVGGSGESFDNLRDDPQALYDTDCCRTEENLEQQYAEVYDPEYYQRQVEQNAMQLHMAADYAALQLIEKEQQRRAKKQDMFRQEMEDRAREEEEALRQQEEAVLQAITSGNQDDLAAILSSNSQWAPDTTTADTSDYYTHHSQRKSSSLLQSFVQGELCTSENAKYVEGKAKQIAEVISKISGAICIV